jgi:DNA (cytosine-5)-methyltransferase 1
VRPQWFFAHPDQPRGLTVREMARLQSFPDSFVFLGSTVKQRVLVGDAVPPLLARAVARALLGCLDC